MKEQQRMIGLFNDLYDGNPWIDVNIMDTLSSISAKDASYRIGEKRNTIWEITEHMICWRENVLQRVQGKVITTPAHNYFEKIKDSSEKGWENTLKRFSATQSAWITFLEKVKQKDFEKIYPRNQLNYYQHIHGILQHDAYHLGQITLLVKIIKEGLRKN